MDYFFFFSPPLDEAVFVFHVPILDELQFVCDN